MMRILFLVLLILVQASPAAACRCAPLSVEEAFENADLVVRARITGLFARDSTATGPVRGIHVRVQRHYKGDTGVEVIHTAPNSAACGIGAIPGQGWWLFARRDGDGYHADSCGGSKQAGGPDDDTAEVLERLSADQAAMPEPDRAPRYEIGELPAASITEPIRAAFATDSVFSPNGAWRLVVDEGSPPRILVERERDTLLELRSPDARDIVAAEWINDTLVTVRAEADGTRAIELLLDVTSGKVLHALETPPG